MKTADIDLRFDHHPPDAKTAVVHERVRAHYKALAVLVGKLGSSREGSLAITALEESLFWANAHIARNLTGKAAVKTPATPGPEDDISDALADIEGVTQDERNDKLTTSALNKGTTG